MAKLPREAGRYRVVNMRYWRPQIITVKFSGVTFQPTIFDDMIKTSDIVYWTYVQTIMPTPSLKIYYTLDIMDFNKRKAMEKELIVILKKYGWTQYASGVSLAETPRIRDIAFEQVEAIKEV